LTVGGARALANHLVASNQIELDAAEIEADIRQHPRLYYPEYVAFCRTVRDKPVSITLWVDLCRG
jgi:hypothetical protein